MRARATSGLRVLSPVCVPVSTDQKRLTFYLPCGLGVESQGSGAGATVGLLCQLSQGNPEWRMQVMCCE